MKVVDVKDMVYFYLKKNGYNGLVENDGECGCEVDDLAPCGEMPESCVAAYKYPCNCLEDHDYHMSPDKPKDNV